MLKAASQLPKLQYFVLAAPGDWSDSGVKHLAKLKELRTVNLYSNTSSAGPLPTLKLTNAAFKTLAEMPSIRSLRMGHSPKITGKCLASLGATSELMDLGLVLVGTVTPADLKGLAGLQALTRLFLMFDSVDDACLKEVAKFPALEYLELAHSSKLSDAGLLPLADAPKLANVWISNCSNLTQAGAKALRDKKTGWKVTLK